ncbi:hypothetical protein QAD02_009037 [Eretmocerus hayati]|uniref:Uncharacterized protein n=1 Tax=Eretmocerus hayati TaxID=131215 RepID=A0ACC2N845_9HYME|nr:hypothetical protein QAD02_009037 [Eretmocerus hayati]
MFRSSAVLCFKNTCRSFEHSMIRCASNLKHTRHEGDKSDDNQRASTVPLFGLLGVFSYFLYKGNEDYFLHQFARVQALEKRDVKADAVYGSRQKGLPTFTLQQINKHDNLKDGVWVCYKEGVYDITNFIKKHPGGSEKIMMAAGGSVDPFWIVFANHKKSEILQLLESMRIGNLSEEDVPQSNENSHDPYALEPVRNKVLKVNGKQPFCAEPPSKLLVQNFITPNDIFYVRNHLPVPLMDIDDYELEFAAESKTVKSIKLDDIRKYPKYSVVSAIMCGGNRRSEMAEAKPLRGLSWNVGAVGNAKWSGARLCDVLQNLGVNEEDYNHIQFEGMDLDPSGKPYGASIPISKAMDPRADVLLAYEMNDGDIPIDHGFPLRVIVPGVVGARNVKWVNRIIFSKDESPSQFQQNDYKGFSPSIDWDNVDFKKAPAIQEMPVTSAICYPLKDDQVPVQKNGTITVGGYAWSGGGKKIIRVDVTADHGKSWHVAELTAQDPNAKVGRHYAWTLWNLDLPVDKSAGQVEIWAKAVDSSYNVQPESFENIWNLRGFLCNAYHRVKINLV